MKKSLIASLVLVPAAFLTGCVTETATYPAYTNSTYVYSGPDTIYPGDFSNVGYGVADYGGYGYNDYGLGGYGLVGYGGYGGYGGGWGGRGWGGGGFHGGGGGFHGGGGGFHGGGHR